MRQDTDVLRSTVLYNLGEFVHIETVFRIHSLTTMSILWDPKMQHDRGYSLFFFVSISECLFCNTRMGEMIL